MHLDPTETRRLYLALLQGFRQSQGRPAEERWQWLAAAHIVGQYHLTLHWDSHCAMLGYAMELRDPREAAGQLFRLALVPLGHLLGRLPAGNTGRATVSAFSPMPLDERSRQLIEAARGS